MLPGRTLLTTNSTRKARVLAKETANYTESHVQIITVPNRGRDIGAFVWTEAALVLTASLALAAGLGWLLSEMLIAMLQHVFDPPPDALAVPWGFLGALAGAAVLATAAATALAALGLRRIPLGQALREQ